MARSEQKKRAALTALLECGSLTEAAEQAGISRRTMYDYIHNDLDFARAYCKAQNRQAVLSMDAMEERRERANSVIMQLLEDETQPAAIRLKAAQIVLSSAAHQETMVMSISHDNIHANKEPFDFSIR